MWIFYAPNLAGDGGQKVRNINGFDGFLHDSVKKDRTVSTLSTVSTIAFVDKPSYFLLEKPVL